LINLFRPKNAGSCDAGRFYYFSEHSAGFNPRKQLSVYSNL